MRRNALAGVGICLMSALVLSPIASAQDIDSSLRASAWTSDREATDRDDVAHLEGWLRGRGDLMEGYSVNGEAWIATSSGGDQRLAGDVREAYLRYRTETLDLKIGRQIISWGRADKINPTDVFASRDHRRLVADDADNRLGIAAIQLTVRGATNDLSFVVAPEFRPTQLPNGEARALGWDTTRTIPSREEQFGVRLDHTGQGFDWALSAAYVNDRIGYIAPSGAAGSAPGYLFPKTVMLGADFATELGGFGLRGEIAFTDPELNGQQEFAGIDQRISTVLGAERAIAPNLNLNIQVLATFNDRPACSQVCAASGGEAFRAANAVRQLAWQSTALGISLRSRYDFLDDRAFAEATGVAYDGGGAVVQMRAGYKLTDDIALQAGVDLYAGHRWEMFGNLQANHGFFIELRRGF